MDSYGAGGFEKRRLGGEWGVKGGEPEVGMYYMREYIKVKKQELWGGKYSISLKRKSVVQYLIKVVIPPSL